MNNIDANKVVEIAQKIGSCDFRVTISNYVIGGNRPWVITVGETTWQRHLVVAQIDETGNAVLLVLSPEQSSNFGYDIDTTDVERSTTLEELIAGEYSGVKEALYPSQVAA